MTCSGRLFQTQAAATEKARSPTVDGRMRLAITSYEAPIAKLRSVTCHVRSHRVTCHPTRINTFLLISIQAGLYSICLPQRNKRLTVVVKKDAYLLKHQVLDDVLHQTTAFVRLKFTLSAITALQQQLLQLLQTSLISMTYCIKSHPPSDSGSLQRSPIDFSLTDVTDRFSGSEGTSAIEHELLTRLPYAQQLT